MSKFLQSSWFVSLMGTICYLVTTALLWRPLPMAQAGTASEIDLATMDASWNFKNPEVDQLIEDLRLEKEALGAREKQLNELDARLKSEWQEICQTTQTVYRLQQNFDQSVVRVKEEELANLKKLAKVYAAMTPEGAASIVKEMNEIEAVKVLAFMKDIETASVLEALAKISPAEAKHAAHLSEKLRLAVFRGPTEKAKSS